MKLDDRARLRNKLRGDFNKLFFLMKKSSGYSKMDEYRHIYTTLTRISDLVGIEIDYDFDLEAEYYKNAVHSNKKTVDHRIYDEKLEVMVSSIDSGLDSFYKDVIKREASPYYSFFAKPLQYRSEEEIFEIAADFFKGYNPNIHKLFERLKKENIYLIDKTFISDGIAYFLGSGFDPYIFIYPEFNVKDSSSLCHELTHAYHFNLINSLGGNRSVNYSSNPLNEIDSHFTELVFFDYWSKINKEEANALLKSFNKTFLTYMMDYVTLCMICNHASDEEISKYRGEAFGYTSLTRETNSFSELFNDYQDVFNYLFGFIYGYKFYELYLEDKERALKEIDKLNNNAATMKLSDLFEAGLLDKSALTDEESIIKLLKKVY